MRRLLCVLQEKHIGSSLIFCFIQQLILIVKNESRKKLGLDLKKSPIIVYSQEKSSA